MVANKTQCRGTDKYPYNTLLTDNFGEKFYICSMNEERHNRAMAHIDKLLLKMDSFKGFNHSERAFLGIESYIR